MAYRIAKLLFPSDKGSARRRKMQILCLTILAGLTASAVIALLFVWVYNSGRF